jgi:hypothetical protein
MRGSNPSTVNFSQSNNDILVRDVRVERRAIDGLDHMLESRSIKRFLREVSFWRSVHGIFDPFLNVILSSFPIVEG